VCIGAYSRAAIERSERAQERKRYRIVGHKYSYRVKDEASGCLSLDPRDNTYFDIKMSKTWLCVSCLCVSCV
jgi:hypothetical protein